MKRIDFENGNIVSNILKAALPMLVAQIMSLLYNIVDRVYIARIPDVGTTALGAVGLCFPIIVIITAFSNLFGTGGAPIFSIERGKGNHAKAGLLMNTSFTLLALCAVILMIVGLLFARPILVLFGASDAGLAYAYPYLMIYLLGTFPSMAATGMNPFINAQGYATTGMTLCYHRRYHQPSAGSAVYLCIRTRHQRRRHCHGYFADIVCCLCFVLFTLQSRISDPFSFQNRTGSLR